MAITDAYATAAEYRAVTSKDDTSEDAEILTDLTAVTRYIEKRIDRFFTKDASAATRVYDPRETGRSLPIDDLVTLTSIKTDTDRDGSFADETAFASTDYELLPRNAAVGPEPSPYTCIYIPTWSTQALFTPGTLVQVVAVFGWNAVPEAVKRACIHMTAILRLETPRATRSVSSDGEILGASFSAQNMIEDLIRHYGRPAF